MKNGNLEKIIPNLPSLHLWENVRQNGGFGPLEAEEFYENVLYRYNKGGNFIETGAGNSSLIFLALNPANLISITNDDFSDLENGIRKFANDYDLDVSALQYINKRSELALPDLVKSGMSFDLCLIDGGHGWPTVFVDFCYLNYMLKKDGVMVLDDVNLKSVKPLFEMLKCQPGWECFYIFKNSKTACFRKLEDEKFLPDFYRQPYFSDLKNQTNSEKTPHE